MPCFVSLWFQNRGAGDGHTYNVIDVWKRNITGAGVVVAVVDEGFDPEHPEIKDNYVSHTHCLLLIQYRVVTIKVLN